MSQHRVPDPRSELKKAMDTLRKSTNEKELETNFRRLSMNFHPDKAHQNKMTKELAEELYKELSTVRDHLRQEFESGAQYARVSQNPRSFTASSGIGESVFAIKVLAPYRSLINNPAKIPEFKNKSDAFKTTLKQEIDALAKTGNDEELLNVAAAFYLVVHDKLTLEKAKRLTHEQREALSHVFNIQPDFGIYSGGVKIDQLPRKLEEAMQAIKKAEQKAAPK